MNKYNKKIAFVSSCVVILFGIFAIPRVTSAQEIFVDGNDSHFTNSVSNSLDAADSNDDFIDTSIGSTYIFGDYNVSTVVIQKVHAKPSLPKPPAPQQTNNSVPATSSSTSVSIGSSDGPGSVLAVAARNLSLPGSYWFLIAFIGNIMMMLMGSYIRLRSGRSPGFAYAV